MFKYGYGELQPLGGYKDKGRDAVHYSHEKDMHTIFSFSVRADWERKILEDAEKIKKYGHPCDEMVYVTNKEINAGDLDRVRALISKDFGFYMRISGMTTTAQMIVGFPILKEMYPEIFFLSLGNSQDLEPFDSKEYISNLKHSFGKWEEKYTPLFASPFEFELSFSQKFGGNFETVPASKIVETVSVRGKSVNVLLGESGAGKTTTLWKLIIEYANKYEDADSLLPILVPLRNWEDSLENLIYNRFGKSKHIIRSLIARGKAILLFDALNELPVSQELRLKAQFQIRSFLDSYPLARCLFTCRTSDYEDFMIDSGRGDAIREFHTNRLFPVQIRDYTKKALGEDLSFRFLSEVEESGKTSPDDSRSIKRLIGIPLFLKFLTDYYLMKQSLPMNAAQLIRFLFFSGNNRYANLREPSFDDFRREDLLSKLACDAFDANSYITISALVARNSIESSISNLKISGIVSPVISSDNIWKDLISDNYLRYTITIHGGIVSQEKGKIEWIHQLLLDYCTAVAIRGSFLYKNPDRKQVLIKAMHSSRYLLIQSALMSLELEDMPNRRILFDELRKIKFGFGEEIIKSVGIFRRTELLMDGLTSYLNRDIINYEDLMDAAFYGYVPGVSKYLADNVKNSPLSHKSVIVKVLSEYVIENCMKRSQDIRESVRYVQMVAPGWIGSHDDGLRFYAAKILWEKDRGLASQTIEKIALNSWDSSLKKEALELIQEWQPE